MYSLTLAVVFSIISQTVSFPAWLNCKTLPASVTCQRGGTTVCYAMNLGAWVPEGAGRVLCNRAISSHPEPNGAISSWPQGTSSSCQLCDADANCTVGSTSDCECRDGFIDKSPIGAKGIVCIRVEDECRTGKAKCSSNAECIDTDDAYDCRCKHGYEDRSPYRHFPGRICTKSPMEIEEPPSQCTDCDALNAICTLGMDGTHVCACGEGTFDVTPEGGKRGSMCLKECGVNITHGCSQNAFCMENPASGGYICQCKPGFTDLSTDTRLVVGEVCENGTELTTQTSSTTSTTTTTTTTSTTSTTSGPTLASSCIAFQGPFAFDPAISPLECNDRDSRCLLWAAKGRCSVNVTEMKKECPVACRFCKPTKSPNVACGEIPQWGWQQSNDCAHHLYCGRDGVVSRVCDTRPNSGFCPDLCHCRPGLAETHDGRCIRPDTCTEH